MRDTDFPLGLVVHRYFSSFFLTILENAIYEDWMGCLLLLTWFLYRNCESFNCNVLVLPLSKF